MKLKKKTGILLMALLAGALLASCAPVSKEVMSRVDETLTYQVVKQDPEVYRGRTVLWGGVIVQTVNRQNETLLFVRQTELDFEKRPKDLDRSAGRFIVRYAGFLDPNIYKEGREITVGGDIAGSQVLPLENTQYTYPMVAAREIHLWEKPQPVYPYYYPYYPYYYPYYDPFWGSPFWWGPYRWHRWR